MESKVTILWSGDADYSMDTWIDERLRCWPRRHKADSRVGEFGAEFGEWRSKFHISIIIQWVLDGTELASKPQHSSSAIYHVLIHLSLGFPKPQPYNTQKRLIKAHSSHSSYRGSQNDCFILRTKRSAAASFSKQGGLREHFRHIHEQFLVTLTWKHDSLQDSTRQFNGLKLNSKFVPAVKHLKAHHYPNDTETGQEHFF